MEGWREEKIKRCRNVEEKGNVGGETNEGNVASGKGACSELNDE